MRVNSNLASKINTFSVEGSFKELDVIFIVIVREMFELFFFKN